MALHDIFVELEAALTLSLDDVLRAKRAARAAALGRSRLGEIQPRNLDTRYADLSSKLNR